MKQKVLDMVAAIEGASISYTSTGRTSELMLDSPIGSRWTLTDTHVVVDEWYHPNAKYPNNSAGAWQYMYKVLKAGLTQCACEGCLEDLEDA